MANFNGQLNQNAIRSAIFNMIISIETFADGLAGDGYSSLVDQARVDGTLYGDTKLYYDVDALKTHAWGNDAEAANLLALDRGPAPKTQKIVLDKFRQIRLTQDSILSKQAFYDEYSFGTYQAAEMAKMGGTKRVYESTTFDAFIGTCQGNTAKQLVEIPLSDLVSYTGEEKNRLEAGMIAQYLADTIADMRRFSRDYNDNQFLKSFAPSSLKFIWNTKFLNKITKLDVPTIFHDDALKDKLSSEDALPPEFFGEVNDAQTTVSSENAGTIRSLIEQTIGDNHYWAGDVIKTGDVAPAGTSYTVDEDVICKIVVKLPVWMSAFSVGTSFFNPRSLTTNNYMTFGHNTLAHFEAYPMVTVHAD